MLPTPFTVDGRVDDAALGQLAEHLFAQGMTGIAVLGFGAECLSLSTDERRCVVAEAARVGGADRLVVGCTAGTAQETWALVEHAGAAGVHAVMVAPPSDRPLTETELDAFYTTTVERACASRVMIQDATQWSATGVGPEVVARLAAQHPTVTYAKPESVPFADATSALAGIPGLTVFSGLGGLSLLDSLRCGAQGTIPFCESASVLAEVLRGWPTGAAERRFATLQPLLGYQLQSLPFAILCSKLLLAAQGLAIEPTMRVPAPSLGPVSYDLLLHHARTAGVIAGNEGQS